MKRDLYLYLIPVLSPGILYTNEQKCDIKVGWKMSDYHVRYSYLKLVKFPNEVGVIPTFREEKLKLTKDETEFVLAALEKYRKEKQDSKQ